MSRTLGNYPQPCLGRTIGRDSFSSAVLLFTIILLVVAPCNLCGQDASQAGRSRPDYSAASAVAYTNSMEVLDNVRPLKKGDQLSMRIVEDKKPPIWLVVSDSGEVEVPLVGRIPAEGKTCKALAYAIRVPLERDYFYHATVIIGLDLESHRSPGTVYVSGQVHNQGPLAIPPDETFTVSKAILRAGGLADFANKKKVKLLRSKPGGGTETIIVNLDLIMKKGRFDLDPEIQPDDRIVVPERLINF
jgi:polysaccharide export outer membrane protein